jgi:hypothetical protein
MQSPNAASVNIGAEEIFVAVAQTVTLSQCDRSALLHATCTNWPTGCSNAECRGGDLPDFLIDRVWEFCGKHHATTWVIVSKMSK